jgi:hypothetical protein
MEIKWQIPTKERASHKMMGPNPSFIIVTFVLLCFARKE